MKDYFTLDGKIEENRRYLREIQDKYENIRQYYPLFFLYAGFIGFYSFEILQWYIQDFNCSITHSLIGLILLIHIILFGYCFYLFTKILFLKNIHVDDQPIDWYSQYEKLKGGKTDFSDKQLEKGSKTKYLKSLEKKNNENFNSLVEKKEALAKVIKYSVYSFLIYISLIFFYKITNMDNSQKPKEEITNIEDLFTEPNRMMKDNREIKGRLLTDSDSTLTEKDVLKIRQIVREEYKKIKQEEEANSFKEGIAKVKENMYPKK